MEEKIQILQIALAVTPTKTIKELLANYKQLHTALLD